MKNALIIHGTGGHSQENWFPWLKNQLELDGIPTIVPDFGSEDKPNIIKWRQVFSNYTSQITEETLLIGHSLGGAFLLKFLQEYSDKVFLIATVGSPIGIKPIKFYDGDYDFLNGFDFEWENIKNKSHHKIVFHSDNDPYVSLGNGERLAGELETDLNFVPHAGHFNESAGYLEFGELFNEIKKYI